MEENLNDPNSPPQKSAALKWSCDVLGLESDEHAINERKTRRAAMVSFLNGLQSNDFSADKKSATAVELIHGKDPQGSPAYLRDQRRKQLRQLDALIRWFASQLGVQDHQRLQTSLRHQLSQLNSENCSEQAKLYAAKIWAAANSVESPTHETNVAAKKALQALFHIATIRATQRNAVRRQHIVRLKKEFSKEQLVVARNTIWQNHDTPNELYHRPFMSLLTSDADSVDAYEIRQPATFSATPAYQDGHRTPASSHTAKEKNFSFGRIALITICVVLAVGGRMGRFANKNQPSPTTPAWSSSVSKPNFKFDPTLAPDDPRSVESALRVLRTLRGEETKLPTVEEFKGIKSRAEHAKQRVEERDAAAANTPISDEMIQRRERERREREQDRERKQQQDKDDGVKAAAEFLRQQEERKKKAIAETPQKASRSRTNDPFKMVQEIRRKSLERQLREIDQEQQLLDKARELEAQMKRVTPNSPSASINDTRQRSIYMRQKLLEEERNRLRRLSPH